ncbi:MAG TPA: septum formation initiator family protein [Pyrinomonadaceae bacterium]|jgi:cell division protein FtsB
MRNRSKSARRSAQSTTPQWFVFVVITSLACMMCMAINLRAYTEMSRETIQFEQLSGEIDSLNNENLIIQQEIYSLKNDPRAIEREARKIGMGRPNEKILVPVNPN